MRSGTVLLVALALIAISTSTATANGDNLAERVKLLEKQVKDLQNVPPPKLPKLDCQTKINTADNSNNFTVSLTPEPGYELVGGSCAFEDYDFCNRNNTMIQVGPFIAGVGERKQKLDHWFCYGKVDKAMKFTVTATYCRITQ